MKRNLLIVLIFSLNTAFAQTNRYDRVQSGQGYVSQYVPIDLEFVKSTGEYMQARFDKTSQQRAAYRDALVKWITQLRTSSDEDEFHTNLSLHETRLILIDTKDLSKKNKDLDQIKIAIEEDRILYNKRMAELPSLFWESANAYTDKKEYSKAIIDYSAIILLKPEYAPAYLMRGFCHDKIEKYTLSLNDYSKYIELMPKATLGYEYRCGIRFHVKEYILAMQDANKIIELDKYSHKGYFWRARIKTNLGDYHGSIADNNKTIELKPDHSMAYNNRGWDYYLLKEYKKAIVDFDKSIILNPKNWYPFDSRQETKFALKDYKGCIEDCKKAIELNPECANSYLYKGRAYYRLGDKTKACESWSKAGELGEMKAYEFIKQYCNN